MLSYLAGISNWGPTNATGVAELVTKEGELRLTASGLSKLQAEQYQIWLINSANGDRRAMDSFNVDDSGVAKLDLVMKQPIADTGWDMLMISVEAAGSKPAAPSDRRAIAGRFPALLGATQSGGTDHKPAELPKTGGSESSSAPPPNVVLVPVSKPLNTTPLLLGGAVALAIVGLAAFGLGRITARRKLP